MDRQGIYIHIPFCLQKCDYCDFLSFEGECGLMEKYTSALLHEMEQYKLTGVIDTVYIGGGTPTALPSHLLCKILPPDIRGWAGHIMPGAEITVEANPGTLTPSYLANLKAHGATRLSIGLQTTKPRLLKAINRIHTMGDFLENYHAARSAGFNNINVDLMFALPGQTVQDWQDTLEEIIALSPQHISAYSLTPAENTPLWDALESGTVVLPGEETDRAMYHMARKLLTEAGYTHYELSNFAKPGFESRHNVNCWRRVPYRAFGLGGHSFDGEKRWHNTEDMTEYLAGNFPPKDVEVLTTADKQAETMILGLRLMQGVCEKNIPHIYTNTVTELKNKGLLTRKNGYVKLTPHGMDLANRVFEAFL
ncbi:MAG: radical SAM family heme chaperone HemW [Firmicutes bacterium]|nr:radical SAM family heme chaperone HemW [Bacillota bacterium]